MNSELPITAFREQILSTIAENQVTIIVADTGAGKSTQVPQYLVGAGYRIVVTQPRRVATRTVAKRVAQEYGYKLGTVIGYRTAAVGDECYSPRTQCLFVTDGLALVRELVGHGRHNVLVIDEVHEWNMNIEVLVAWVRRRLAEQPDFKVVLMSATLEADKLSAYFGEAPIINIPGRLYPVTEVGPSACTNAQEAAIYLRRGNDVLVFEPGKREIEETIEDLQMMNLGVDIMPLHGELDAEDQDRCFAPSRRPKCVVATNVAETSVTIPGITVVIDSGMEKRVEVRGGVEGLYARPISFANSKQRMGRAGRCEPGVYVDRCEARDHERPQFPTAEIMRRRLDQTVLRLADAGFDMEELEFFHQPAKAEIHSAKESLKALGCLDQQGRITDLGRKISRLPVSPRYARMILEADRLGVVDDVIVIAAILEGGEITVRDQTMQYLWRSHVQGEVKSDLMAQLMMYRIGETLHKRVEFEEKGIFPKAFYRAREIYNQLREALKDEVTFNSSGNRDNILKSVCAGMVDLIFVVQDGMLMASAQSLPRQINRMSVVAGRVYHGLIVGMPFDLPLKDRLTGREGIVLHLVRMITLIEPHWLVDIAPHLIVRQEGTCARYDSESGCAVATTRISYKGLIVQEYEEALPADHPDVRRLKGEWENRQAWNAFLRANPRPLMIDVNRPTVARVVYAECAITGADLIAYATVSAGAVFSTATWTQDHDEAYRLCGQATAMNEERARRRATVAERPVRPSTPRWDPTPPSPKTPPSGGFGSLADAFGRIGR